LQLNLLVLSYLASAAVVVGVALAAWRRRRLVGAGGLALLMLAVGWWLLANALEASAVDRSMKIAWSVVAYPGIESAPVLYLLFVLAWTRQDGWLTRGRVALLLLVPTVSVGIAATNEWHHLLWSGVTLIDAWGVTAVYEHGPWFWVEAAYAYLLVGLGLFALVAAIYRYPRVYSARMRIVIVGSLAPVAASVVYVAGLESSVHADLSSIAFAVAGLIGAWAVLRARLLEVMPVAWPTLVDSLADAVLVLDPGTGSRPSTCRRRDSWGSVEMPWGRRSAECSTGSLRSSSHARRPRRERWRSPSNLHSSSHKVSRGRQRLRRRLGGSTCGSAPSRTRGGAMRGCSWSCAR
jgi:hypothetical protein